MSSSLNASSNPARASLQLRLNTTFPCDLVEDILCRLPLKLLVQLSCACKSWNSLVSDPKFAKKHLQGSLKLLNRHHLLLRSRNPFGSFYWSSYWNSPLSSVFNTMSTSIPQTQLSFPPINFDTFDFVDSCNGILCFGVHDLNKHPALLWNPSVRKFKEICLLEDLDTSKGHNLLVLSFGYSISTDDYKVVAVSCYYTEDGDVESEVIIYTLNTDSLESIGEFPYGTPIGPYGRFLNNTVNWVATADHRLHYVVSLDLGNNSYQKFLLPHHGIDVNISHLTVVRDCLCIIYNTRNHVDYDVWVLNDYGNEHSWNKWFSFTTPDMVSSRVLYMHEDDVLLQLSSETAIYNGTSRNLTVIQSGNIPQGVYIESLIWPCP